MSNLQVNAERLRWEALKAGDAPEHDTGVGPIARVGLAAGAVPELRLTDDATILVEAAATRTNGGLTVSGIIVDDEDVERQFSQDVTVPSDGTSSTVRFALGGGRLRFIAVRGSTTTLVFGEAFVRIVLAEGTTTLSPRYQELCSGFWTNRSGPCWPVQVQGLCPWVKPDARVLTVGNPAAGAEWSVTFSASEVAEIVGVAFRFVADATAANRFPVLIADDGSVETGSWICTNNQVAGQTIDYAFTEYGGAVANVTGHVNVPMSGFFVPSGGRLRTSTVAIQVGDQYSNIRLTLRQRALAR